MSEYARPEMLVSPAWLAQHLHDPRLRIGERSSLTWFVLKYLLGLPQVCSDEGSWTE